MILLHTASHDTQAAWSHPHGGRLVVPRDCARVEETHAAGIPWAADNSAFGDFDEPAFRRMIDRLAGVGGGLFVAAPDVVEQTPAGPRGDWPATLDLFHSWLPLLLERRLPPAIVLQDGLDPREIPWPQIAAVFVGGSDAFKYGPEVRAACREARRRGAWIHFGRVNTIDRARYAAAVGADSFDGTKFSVWRDTHLGAGLELARALSEQGRQMLFDEDPPAAGGSPGGAREATGAA